MTDLRQAATLALDALTYIYTDTTADEDELIDQAITAIKEALAQPPLPVQEPLEYWNAVEGWVKIDEMREHFDSVNCGTIYKHGGEGRVPLYTAPPQRQWDKPSASFNEWWNGDYEDPANPFEKDSAAYWAWAGWKAAQRPWVGLTEEYLEQIDTEEIYGVVGNHMAIAMAVEAVLKEKNG